MSLMDTIRAAQVNARKAKDSATATLLTTLLGEAGSIGKNDGNRETTDAEAIAVIRKFIKNNEETAGYLSIEEQKAPYVLENQLLGTFLPTQLSDAELKSVIIKLKEELNAGPKDMGKIMARLKVEHDGTYDGRLASTLVKEVLQ